MPRPRTASGTWIEPAALVASLATAGLLLAVSVLLGDAPERLGRSALAEFSERMEERALLLWREQLESPAEDALRAGNAAPPAPAGAVEPEPASLPPSIAFDALLRQAHRERWSEGSAEAARSSLESALELPVDTVRRVRARYALLGIARALDDRAAARSIWSVLASEASGAEVDKDGDSLFLLSALTLAPLLEQEDERARLREEVVGRFCGSSPSTC